MNIIINKSGSSIKIDELKQYNVYKKLLKNFTISYKTISGYIQKVQCYKRDTINGTIIFPRFGILKCIKNCKCNITIDLKQNNILDVVWTGSYTSNQLVIKNYIMNNIYNTENLNNGNCGLILNLDAGQGKSFLAAGLIQDLKVKTLIICHNKSILNQWVDILVKLYPTLKIGTYYGGKKIDGDIIVSIVNSLMMDKFILDDIEIEKTDFFNMFGYVILDEVHEYTGKKRKLIYNYIQSSYMLGLSATPDENIFGLDKVNIWNCGNIIKAVDLDGYTQEIIDFTAIVKKIEYKGHSDYTKLILNDKLGVVSCPSMISQLCEDPYRIKVIVKYIYELINKKQFIFVFTDRREYLNKIKIILEENKINSHFLLNNKDAIVISNLMGGSKAEEINDAKLNSNIILTTYQFMGTGVSIPKMDSIILATPRKSKSRQYVNRIFRLGSDVSIERIIIDIVDVHTPMKSQYYERKKYYDEKKYKITKYKINWNFE